MKVSVLTRLGPAALSGLLLLTATSATASAQRGRTDSLVAATVDSMLVRYRDALTDTSEIAPKPEFESRSDSLQWAMWKTRANSHMSGMRVVVSIFDRRLTVLRGPDTLLVAPIAVASGTTLEYAGRRWTFRTPRGQRPVLRKVLNPVWTPPDWLYAEVASAYGLKLARLDTKSSIPLSDGRRLTVRRGIVGLLSANTREFTPLPIDEHIVFNSTLYIPPFGSGNRTVPGELGHFALDLGDGYLIHGTPDQSSIGRPVTHGCVRMADIDIAWMYENVPVGTPVFIY